MGIVKIADDLHQDLREASKAMARSVNAQAEYWMKIGMLAQANPELSFNEIVQMQLRAAQVELPVLVVQSS